MAKYCVYIGGKKRGVGTKFYAGGKLGVVDLSKDYKAAMALAPYEYTYRESAKDKCFRTVSAARKHAKRRKRQGFDVRIWQRDPSSRTAIPLNARDENRI